MEPYKTSAGTGEMIFLPGNTSCSRNASVALSFAFEGVTQEKQPVLFIKLVHNYMNPYGIMMNSEAYSSYPQEAELLLVEGCEAFVLGIEEDVVIGNKHQCLEPYSGKKVMVVYMFLSDYFGLDSEDEEEEGEDRD